MYNELILLIKTCIEFWKGFFSSDNKSAYLKKQDSFGYILMLVFSILLFITVIYLIIKLFSGASDVKQLISPTPPTPIVAEKTQTIPVNGKNIVCNVKIEVYVPSK